MFAILRDDNQLVHIDFVERSMFNNAEHISSNGKVLLLFSDSPTAAAFIADNRLRVNVGAAHPVLFEGDLATRAKAELRTVEYYLDPEGTVFHIVRSRDIMRLSDPGVAL